MHLYNLTLKKPSSCNAAVLGNFSGTLSGSQEILISRGTALDLLSIESDTGKLSTICSTNVFGSIRALARFRLPGDTKDYALVTSDSGNLSILSYSVSIQSFYAVHQVPYGRSGTRRIIPGQYIAVDPKGRSLMLAAMEERKLVYTLSHDHGGNITVSSPLEGHRLSSIVFDVTALDVGFDNPIYAVLEADFDDRDESYQPEKTLAFYELDFGLNHVVRKDSALTDPKANRLVSLPGGAGALLVCCEGSVIYHRSGFPSFHVPIPRRQGLDVAPLITASVVHKIAKTEQLVLQTEHGDLFKVTMLHSSGDTELVVGLHLSYFDTIPICSSLLIMKSGFLFAGCEFGDQKIYQFLKLGEDGPVCASSVSSLDDRLEFRPAAQLSNLLLADTLLSLNPIIKACVIPPKTMAESAKMILACGRGSESALHKLEPGMELEKVTSVEVGGLYMAACNGIWTIGINEYAALIILSFPLRTVVLSITGDGQIQETEDDSGFSTSTTTLYTGLLASGALIQVHSRGLLRTSISKSDIHPSEIWRAPEGSTITCATMNKRQIIIVLDAVDLVYFELDNDNHLNEFRCSSSQQDSRILAIGVGIVPEGRLRTSYMAVGCQDQTIKLMSLMPGMRLTILGIEALIAPPSSLLITSFSDSKQTHKEYLLIGLQNGVLIRTEVDLDQGELVDSRSRFLGSKPVLLSKAQAHGQNGVLACSSRVWLIHPSECRVQTSPVYYCDGLTLTTYLTMRSAFQGIIAIGHGHLSILKLQKSPLKTHLLGITPRQMAFDDENGLWYIAKSDHRQKHSIRGECCEAGSNSEWISSIEAVNSEMFLARPVDSCSVFSLGLESDEVALSLAVTKFHGHPSKKYLIVGTATRMVVSPPSQMSAFLRVYEIMAHQLNYMHQTAVDEAPLSLVAFNGMLLAGVGKFVRLYDLGKKKLLLKSEQKTCPTKVVTLDVQGNRIIVGDIQHSIFFISYNPDTKELSINADDTQSRWITAAAILDSHTVVAGDKFGSIFMNRIQSDRSLYKTDLLAHFHVGDVVTSLHKVSLAPGQSEVIVYTCLHGTIGVLAHFSSQSDIELLKNLEQHIRAAHSTLLGRDHLAWRGYYTPVKAVVDGDLCEAFLNLSFDIQMDIAKTLDRSVGEVSKKLDQLREHAVGDFPLMV